MGSELHLRPDRLRAHAVESAGLSEELRAALTAAAAVPLGARAGAPAAEEQERLCAAVRRAVRELAELSAVLAGAAAAAEAADEDAARALRTAAEAES